MDLWRKIPHKASEHIHLHASTFTYTDILQPNPDGWNAILPFHHNQKIQIGFQQIHIQHISTKALIHFP